MDPRKRHIDHKFKAQTNADRAAQRINSIDSSSLHKSTSTIKSGYNMHGVTANKTSLHSVRENASAPFKVVKSHKSADTCPSSALPSSSPVRSAARVTSRMAGAYVTAKAKEAWTDVKDSSFATRDAIDSAAEAENKKRVSQAVTATSVTRSQVRYQRAKHNALKDAASQRSSLPENRITATPGVMRKTQQTRLAERMQVKARSNTLDVKSGLMDKTALQKKNYLRGTFRGARMAALGAGAALGAANSLADAALGERDIPDNPRARSLARRAIKGRERKRLSAIRKHKGTKKLIKRANVKRISKAKNIARTQRQFRRSLGTAQKAALKIKQIASKVATQFARVVAQAVKGIGAAIKALVAAASPYLLAIIGGVVALLLLFAVIFGIAGANRPASTGDLVGNERIIADFYLSRGLTPEATAAIMGNMYQESGFNPGSIQDGNIAKGILQWENPRFKELERFAASRGKLWTDLETQLEFSLIEIRSMISAYSGIKRHVYPNGEFSGWQDRHYTFEEWNQIKNVALQTEIFERTYTRASIPNMPRRIAKALEIYAALTSKGKVVASDAERQKIVDRAFTALGTRYVWGGCSPDGFDCSGLVSYAIRGKYEHTWTTYDLIKWQRTNDPKVGDLVVNDHHVGIVIGNGQMIHAPQTGDVVKISPYNWMFADGNTFFVTPQGFIP